MQLEGSRTQANLWTAFHAESEALCKYQLYAEKARRDGYRDIARVFTEIAGNEQAHAAIWLRELSGLGGLADNLRQSADNELVEWSDMYATMAREARSEGFEKIAALFDGVAEIEKAHEQRFRALLQDAEGQRVFSRDGDAIWQCLNCGHVHIGPTAPDTCPVCAHPQAYFALQQAG